MAFRSETSAVMVSESADAAIAAFEGPKVDNADARRVRIALGLMVLVALADCLLYLPRLF